MKNWAWSGGSVIWIIQLCRGVGGAFTSDLTSEGFQGDKSYRKKLAIFESTEEMEGALWPFFWT